MLLAAISATQLFAAPHLPQPKALRYVTQAWSIYFAVVTVVEKLLTDCARSLGLRLAVEEESTPVPILTITSGHVSWDKLAVSLTETAMVP
jgi:hypothetical protein